MENTHGMTIEKNTSIFSSKKDTALKRDFNVSAWCQANNCKFSVEECKHDAKLDGGVVEKRTTHYNVPDVYVKRDGSRRTVSDAMTLMVKLLEDSTVGSEAESIVIAFGMKHLNVTLGNNARRTLQVKVSKKIVRAQLNKEIAVLITRVASAAAEGNMLLVQQYSKQMQTRQAELNAL